MDREGVLERESVRIDPAIVFLDDRLEAFFFFRRKRERRKNLEFSLFCSVIFGSFWWVTFSENFDIFEFRGSRDRELLFSTLWFELDWKWRPKVAMIDNWSSNKLRNLGFRGEGYGCGFNDVIGIRSRSE